MGMGLRLAAFGRRSSAITTIMNSLQARHRHRIGHCQLWFQLNFNIFHCRFVSPKNHIIQLSVMDSIFLVADSLIDAVLKAHNNLRALHGVPSLKWSPPLSKEAQAWAEKLSRNGELRHANKEERKFKGENICRMSNHYDVTDAVRIWYSEINSYKYDSPGFSFDTGHFTQIVWRDTAEVGVGTCKSRDGSLTYIVARYNPPGNVLKNFHENVLKTKSRSENLELTALVARN